MRGIDSRHEIDPTLLLRDTRTLTQRIADFFSDPSNAAIVLFSLAAAAYLHASKYCPSDYLKFLMRKIIMI
jgi:hypothetical protein